MVPLRLAGRRMYFTGSDRSQATSQSLSGALLAPALLMSVALQVWIAICAVMQAGGVLPVPAAEIHGFTAADGLALGLGVAVVLADAPAAGVVEALALALALGVAETAPPLVLVVPLEALADGTTEPEGVTLVLAFADALADGEALGVALLEALGVGAAAAVEAFASE